jgi:hypothetical protein
MTLENDRVEIAVRLLTNGRYTWTISLNSAVSGAQGSLEILKNLDSQLKDKFPDHVSRSSSKVSYFDEE